MTTTTYYGDNGYPLTISDLDRDMLDAWFEGNEMVTAQQLRQVMAEAGSAGDTDGVAVIRRALGLGE